MFVPMNVNDFLKRAETVYPDRVAVIDEPDQPAAPFGPLTYREMAAKARAQSAALDDLGVPVGGRVAIVSHNSARLLTSFYGVSGSGRVLVPVNFRLAAPEVSYIVGHSGAEVLLVDPELDESLAEVTATHRFVLGESDDVIFPAGRVGAAWEGDEAATATINYTSGTTARPKGVQLTHRNLWMNAMLMGLHLTVNDRDVLLHTLPMFHANGWGMPYAITGVGGKHIVLRKVDGAEILRRVEEHGVTVMCGAPAVLAMVLDAAANWDGPIPGRDRVRVVVAGAPPPTRTIERIETELGWEFIQIYGLTETAPLLTVNRRRSEWDDLDTAERASMLGRAGVPALGVDVEVDEFGEILARGNVVLEAYWNQSCARGVLEPARGDGGRLGRRLVPHRRRRHHERWLPVDQRSQEGRDHHRRGERVVDRGGGRDHEPPERPGGGRGRCTRRQVGRGRHGAGGHRWHTAHCRRLDRALPVEARGLQVPQADRVPRSVAAHRDGQAAEVPDPA